MSYFLFIIYLLLCSWILCKIKFIVNAGLSKKIIVILFLTKVFAGVFSGWLSHAYPNSDSWQFHTEALKEYYLLFSHPKEYFTNLFTSNYIDTYGGLFKSTNSYWNDLKTNLMVKLVSVLHIFSFGNYYINVIIYNFLIFFGNIALFRFFSKVYKTKSLLLVVLCFLLPSFLFFSSGINKEGLITAAIGIIIYVVYTVLCERKIDFKKIVALVVSLLFVFLLRNFVFMALLPALAALIISRQFKYSPIYIYTSIYLICIVLFFTVGKMVPSIDLPQVVVDKQVSFFELEKAKTFITTDTLQANFTSFLLNAPQALDHAILRPNISDGHLSTFMYPMAAEIILYEIIFIVFLFIRRKDTVVKDNSFILFGLFFSISLLLIIGYTTPVLGAIIRYRSIYLPFLLTPLIMSIDYKKISSILSIKK